MYDTTETARLDRTLALNAAEVLDTFALAATTAARRLRARATTAARPASAHPPQPRQGDGPRRSRIAVQMHGAERAWRLK